MSPRTPLRLALLASGAIAALLYSNFVLDWTRQGFVGMDDIVSKLEAPGQPHALLLRTTDVVCVILVLCLLPWVRSALPPSRARETLVWSTAGFGLGAAIAAFVPTPCGPDVLCSGRQLQSSIHDIASIASDAALYVGVAAAWWASRHSGPAWFHRASWWVFWVGGVSTSALFAWFESTDDPEWALGASQRAHIVCISAWIACLALLAARQRFHTHTHDPDTRTQETHHAHHH